MNSKQRFSVIFSMLSLVVLMLGFQNCSSGDGLNNFGSTLDDGGLVIPPSVFASKTVNCSQPYTDFKITENIYICVQNAGIAPIYCHTYAGSSQCARETISTVGGWSGMNGNWVKGFSASTVFGVGSFTSYGVHTDDPSAIGQANFNVSQ